MKRAYKYRLYPNKTQQAMLRQTFGCCRYVYDSTYNKLLTAKGVFLENVPDGNNAPSLYFVGSSDTVTTVFVSEFNARVWFVLTLSHTSKKLSLVSTGYVSDVVRYGEGQNLTDVQKQQARSNIGVQSADELLADDDFIAQLKTKLGID